MKTKRFLVFCALLMLTVALLIACATSEQDLVRPETSTDNAGLWVKVQSWLTRVAWSAATVPIIGPLITGILGEVAPESHWIVGGILILLILSALGGGTASRR